MLRRTVSAALVALPHWPPPRRPNRASPRSRRSSASTRPPAMAGFPIAAPIGPSPISITTPGTPIRRPRCTATTSIARSTAIPPGARCRGPTLACSSCTFPKTPTLSAEFAVDFLAGRRIIGEAKETPGENNGRQDSRAASARSRNRTLRCRRGRRRLCRPLHAASSARTGICRRACMRPAAASAAPGTGTAIPARAATSRACSTRSPSRRSSTRNGPGRRNIRRSRKSSPTPITSPIVSACASDIVFDTRVTAASWDERAKRWHIETDRGDKVSAKFCIMAVGCLSAPNRPKFPGIEDFEGPVYHTGEWPHEGVDFTGLRVGVIGTGIVGDPVDPDHRRAGLAAHRVPAHRDLVGAGLERGADAGLCEGGQGRLSGAAREGARAADRLLFSVQHEARAGGERGRTRSGSTRKPGNAAACPSSAPSATSCSRRAPTTPSPISRATRSAASSRIPPPPSCCVRTMCSAASGSASIPAITPPTICRM